jgi:hypothetical protein
MMAGEAGDRWTGLTDTEAIRIIAAHDKGQLFAEADVMGIDRRMAYNVALGRSGAYDQWSRCHLRTVQAQGG